MSPVIICGQHAVAWSHVTEICAFLFTYTNLVALHQEMGSAQSPKLPASHLISQLHHVVRLDSIRTTLVISLPWTLSRLLV